MMIFFCLGIFGLYEFIQGSVLNLSLYLLTLLKGALESRTEFILFKKDSVEISTFIGQVEV